MLCAPGYPGNTQQAQPTMDLFAAAAARAAGLAEGSLGAVYYETEPEGFERLGKPDAALALVPFPFYVKHSRDLGLKARLQVVGESGASELWSLIVKKGQAASPASLAGWEITGPAGYSESFVLGPALGGWGPLPADVRVTCTGRALSALRRAASGEKLAVLVDHAQADGLSALPFGSELEVLARSKPLPESLVCTVGTRLTKSESGALMKGLSRLHGRTENAELLKTMRMVRFEPVDPAAIEALIRPSPGTATGAQ